MTADVTPLIIAALQTLAPIVIGFIVNLAFKAAWPAVERSLGEKTAASLQERVNQVLNAGIGFAVQKASESIVSRGAITVQTRNLMVDIAVGYTTKHAPELMSEAGDVVEKVLARFDQHPAVQGLIAATAPAPTTT